MKTNIKKIISGILLGSLALLSSCSSDDNSSKPNSVFSTTTSGAILRTISINQGTFNFISPSDEWSATLEIQGISLNQLREIKLYAKHVSTATSDEAYIKSFNSSIFQNGPFNLPRGDVKVSLTEVLSGLQLTDGEYTASDKFILRFEMVLTDGRTFSSNNASATVTGGSYFSSPFQYSAQFFCPLTDASTFNGTYTVVTDAWADYAAGDTVPVVYDPADGQYTFRIMSTNNPYISNASTSYMKVTINPNDGSVTVQSNEDFNYPGFAVLSVTGIGTVGTCTGDINLVLDFGPYTENSFILTKN